MRTHDLLSGPAKTVLMKLASVKAWPAWKLQGMCAGGILQNLLSEGLITTSEPCSLVSGTPKWIQAKITEEGRWRLKCLLGEELREGPMELKR